jgi:Transglutaminase-like superfamily
MRFERSFKERFMHRACIILLLMTVCAAPSFDQTKKQRVQSEVDPDQYIARDRSSRMNFQLGLRIEATGSSVQRATATVVNPIEWPEQQVTFVSEEAPPGVRIDIRKTAPTAQQMLMKIPGLTAGSAIVCTRTFELTRWTQRVRLEARVKLAAVSPEHAKPLLLPSEGIESTHAEIRKFAEESIGDKTDVWDRVNALFMATRRKIKYVQGPFAGALAGLRSGQGDCEELSCLFIAACRASGIPARIIWGPEHTWTEFALEDPNGNLVWIPADPSKERELGVINHFTPILQKGDRFLVPEMPGKPQRYLAPVCKGTGGTPLLQSIEKIEPIGLTR